MFLKCSRDVIPLKFLNICNDCVCLLHYSHILTSVVNEWRYEFIWSFRNQLTILMSVILSDLRLAYLLTYSKLYRKGPCPASKKSPKILTQQRLLWVALCLFCFAKCKRQIKVLNLRYILRIISQEWGICHLI